MFKYTSTKDKIMLAIGGFMVLLGGTMMMVPEFFVWL